MVANQRVWDDKDESVNLIQELGNRNARNHLGEVPPSTAMGNLDEPPLSGTSPHEDGSVASPPKSNADKNDDSNKSDGGEGLSRILGKGDRVMELQPCRTIWQFVGYQKQPFSIGIGKPKNVGDCTVQLLVTGEVEIHLSKWR